MFSVKAEQMRASEHGAAYADPGRLYAIGDHRRALSYCYNSAILLFHGPVDINWPCRYTYANLGFQWNIILTLSPYAFSDALVFVHP